MPGTSWSSWRMEVLDMAMAPVTKGSVKWQLCYDMRAKTWWMVSGGSRIGEPVLGLGHWILEGGTTTARQSGTAGQRCGGVML